MSLQTQMNKNLVRYMELIPGQSAFIDARSPDSHLKDNFCIIGAGVAENSKQHVHIKETSGFNIGAAGQPPGIKNSLHSHTTAEIFIVFKGKFRFYWGNDGEHEVILSQGDVITIPVNLFRGFEVIGRDYGFMYSVLGGDNAGGGVTWHPNVIEKSKGYGLFLRNDGTLADTQSGDNIPDADSLMPLLTELEMQTFDQYTYEEMLPFVALQNDYSPILPDFEVPDYKQYALTGSATADYDFHVNSNDEVSIQAYALNEGAHIPMHRRNEKQVLINFKGDTKVKIQQDKEVVEVILTTGDILNIPVNVSISLECIRGDSFIYCILGDNSPRKPELVK